MRNIIYLHTARRELNAIAVYIAGQAGEAAPGLRVVSDIEAKLEHIASLPFAMGVPAHEAGSLRLRRITHGNFTLYVRYKGSDTLEVFTVLWGGRDRDAYFAEASSK